jgi:hypothetical protein
MSTKLQPDSTRKIEYDIPETSDFDQECRKQFTNVINTTTKISSYRPTAVLISKPYLQ